MCWVVAFCGVELFASASYQEHFAFVVSLRQGGSDGCVARIRMDVEGSPNVWIRECGGVREFLDYRGEGYMLRVAPSLFDIFAEEGV